MENFLTTLAEINDKINAFIWVKIGLVLLIGTGILMTCCTKWFQISHIGHWWQQTIGGALYLRQQKRFVYKRYHIR